MTSLQGSHVREKTAFKKRGHNGTGAQWDGDTMGRGHNEWDGGPPVGDTIVTGRSL